MDSTKQADHAAEAVHQAINADRAEDGEQHARRGEPHKELPEAESVASRLC